MMKLAQLLLILLLSVAILPSTASADNEPTWYDIELILFRHGSSAAGQSENWPADPGSPDWSSAVNLVSAGSDGSGQQRPYSLLPQSAWRLTPEYNALRKTRGELEPLFHKAWRQPVDPPNSAKPIHLGAEQGDGLPLAPFEGLIKISVNRYLHVELDLLLRRAVSINTTLNSAEAALTPSLGSVRVTGKRRMRSGEIHYIDHPLMGALILISRVEMEPPTPAEPINPEEAVPTKPAETSTAVKKESAAATTAK
ncbi:MAG: hypothetical protein FHK82_17650 [Sedimenticola thiotaurini]|uniref:Histidine phosphatase family protein n=1 Tax=Sedimenticola thiotaurini TaxID=1543721 RepID=A0A558CIM8_9GAMM|nr:MAG: hypothetical protein FHK82_17650 [Sedimenticola thiotaurini]